MSLVHPSRSRTDCGSSSLMSARDSSGLAAGAATVGGRLMQPGSTAAQQPTTATTTPANCARRGAPIGSTLAMVYEPAAGTHLLPACLLLVQRGCDISPRSTNRGQKP